MLFHEIYSTYFQTVAKILTEAVDHPLTSGEIDSIVREYAFDESTLNIPESLGIAHWKLLKEDGCHFHLLFGRIWEPKEVYLFHVSILTSPTQ